MLDSTINIADFEKICRICLKESDTLMNIFCSDAVDIITKISSIQPHKGDLLPENICISCMDKGTEYFKFKQMYEKNNEYLQSILKIKSNKSSIDKLSQVKLEDFDLKIKNIDLNNSLIQDSKENTEYLEVSKPKVKVNVDDLEYKDDNKKGSLCTNSCHHCQANFSDFPSFLQHTKEYHPCDNEHYCHVCTKEFSFMYADPQKLENHLNSHKNPPKVSCEFCHKNFRSKYEKTIHTRIHTGEKPITCTICKKGFRDPRYLVIHLKTHSGKKPFSCTICNKEFSLKVSLKTHMKTHTKERNYMCNLCGKTFVYSHNLKIHSRQHSGEKPYNCKVCFNSFSSSSILAAHMLTHSENKRFNCKNCEKKFKRSGDLSVHMRSHTDQKPYVCSLCPNRYKMSSHLTEHMKTHTAIVL